MYYPSLSKFDLRLDKWMRSPVRSADKKYFQPELPTTMLTCLLGADPPARQKWGIPRKPGGMQARKKDRKEKEQKRKKPSQNTRTSRRL